MRKEMLAIGGVLSLVLILGTAMYAVAEVLPGEDAEDQNETDTTDQENNDPSSENESEPIDLCGSWLKGHGLISFIMGLDDNASDEINLTKLKEDLSTLLDELSNKGYFNRTHEHLDCNRTFLPCENRTHPDNNETDHRSHHHGLNIGMRNHHRHKSFNKEEITEVVEELDDGITGMELFL